MRNVELTLRTIASGVFFIAGALYLASMGTLYFYADGMQRQVREYEHPRDPLKKSGAVITGHRLPGTSRFKDGYLELAKFGDIDGGRSVSITTPVTVRELLKPGEVPPSASMLEVFAQARAVLYAQQECGVLVETLARECEVQHADGRVDDGRIVVTATLGFVQKDDFGALEKGATYVFSTAQESTPRGAHTTASAGGRRAVYRKVVER